MALTGTLDDTIIGIESNGVDRVEARINELKLTELQKRDAVNDHGDKEGKAGGGVVASPADGVVPDEDWLSVRVLTEKASEAFQKIGHHAPIQILDRGVNAGLAADDGVFAGFVRNQTIYHVREGLRSEASAIDTIWHELLHFGIRRFPTRDQYIEQMGRLYSRDSFVQSIADAWIKNDPAAIRMRDAGEPDSYIKTRGTDEALAQFAESIEGNVEFNQSGIEVTAIRAIKAAERELHLGF